MRWIKVQLRLAKRDKLLNRGFIYIKNKKPVLFLCKELVDRVMVTSMLAAPPINNLLLRQSIPRHRPFDVLPPIMTRAAAKPCVTIPDVQNKFAIRIGSCEAVKELEVLDLDWRIRKVILHVEMALKVFQTRNRGQAGADVLVNPKLWMGF